MAEIGTIEVGDLIQLTSWFGDVWAEVLGSYPQENGLMGMVTFPRYNKYGVKDRDDLLLWGRGGYADIRKVAKKEEVNPRHSIIMLPNHKIRHGTIWLGGKQIGVIDSNYVETFA